MSHIDLTCPFCQYTRNIPLQAIPVKARWATCPECKERFPMPPLKATVVAPESQPFPNSPAGIDLEGDVGKSQNLWFAAVFLMLFLALVGGRLFFSSRAQNIPAPNFIAASEQGIATHWRDQILVTDHEGTLIRRIALPENMIPTQLIWAGEELWVPDYRSKKILVISQHDQHWFALNGPRISAHFKVFPDFTNQRIFLSDGAAHSINTYDFQGRLRSSFGREGRNPGELKFPNQFLLEDSGTLLIANTKSPGIDRYSADGSFIERVVTPTGDPDYLYPTGLALAAGRIVTLECDGFLQDGRIALYTAQGDYLRSQQGVEDFKLIGDLTVWEDRVLATDLANAKVYAFATDDLRFLGEFSADLKRIGDGFQDDFHLWDQLSKLCLWGLLIILVALIYFYVKFRKHQDAQERPTSNNGARPVENLSVNGTEVSASVAHIDFSNLEFIAVKASSVVDVLSVALIAFPVLFSPWLLQNKLGCSQELILFGMAGCALSLGPGVLLSANSNWGSAVSLKRARKLLEKLVKNQGMKILGGVAKVGIAHGRDKTSRLLLMTPKALTVAEFSLFGQLTKVYRVDWNGVVVKKENFIFPAISLHFAGEKWVAFAVSRTYLTRLRSTLEDYRKNFVKTTTQDSPAKRAQGTERTRSEDWSREGKFNNHRAALLSLLFPGLGQFYQRRIIRGALFMVGFTLMVFMIAVNLEGILAGSVDWTPESMGGMGVVLALGLLLISSAVWDAWKN